MPGSALRCHNLGVRPRTLASDAAGRFRWWLAPPVLATALGCGVGSDPPSRKSRLVVTGGSIDIAWLPSGLYSIELLPSTGLVNAELVRIDPETGATTVIPWPESPCDEAVRRGLSGRNGKLYVARTCNPISGPPRANDYIVYDPDASSWSTLATGVWDDPPHAELAWDDAAQEGLFTTPDQSCSSVYRLTPDGPAFVEQTVPTPLGNVDTRAGLTLRPDDADCLRDGRILGAPVNQQDQIALMVSPVKGPPGPDRLDEQSALVIAQWTPGSSTPLSAFQTVSEPIDSASPPAWSTDDKSVFWSGNGFIMRADVASAARTRIAAETADQVAPSPDGTKLALRRSILTKDYQSVSEIRIVELPSPR